MTFDKKITNLASQALSESIDQRSMIQLACEIIPNYKPVPGFDVPEGTELPRSVTAQVIINDMNVEHLLVPFLNVFFSIQFTGFKGRKYRISKFRELLVQLYNAGFSIEEKTGLIYEDPRYRISKNWGVLREGESYQFTLLWSSILPQKITEKQPVSKTILKTFSQMVQTAVESRNGRIWHIEEAGILSAFHFGNHQDKSFYAALELLNKIYDYNRFQKRLKTPVEIRLCLTNGIFDFSKDINKLTDHEAVATAIKMQAVTDNNTISIGRNLTTSLSGILSSTLDYSNENGRSNIFVYRQGALPNAD